MPVAQPLAHGTAAGNDMSQWQDAPLLRYAEDSEPQLDRGQSLGRHTEDHRFVEDGAAILALQRGALLQHLLVVVHQVDLPTRKVNLNENGRRDVEGCTAP